MSIKTWKKEFYPIKAEDAVGSELEAAEHSLKKWEGLTKENLEKHGVRHNWLTTIENKKGKLDEFIVDSGSCSLCLYCNGICKNCILFKINKTSGESLDCDEGYVDQHNKYIKAPYEQFIYNNNPNPMIKLLKKAVKQLKKQQVKNKI